MKFWHSNRLDQEAEYDPRDVAKQFIAAVRDGYDLSPCGVSMEFAYRWWLTDPKGFDATWDEQDSDTLMRTLAEAMGEADRDMIWDSLEANEARA